MSKSFNCKKGFTLAELLVVGAIIAILSAIVVPNYKSMNSQYALSLAASQFVQNARNVQEMALAASECQVCGGVPSRYGIFIKSGSNSYQIAAEIPGDSTPGVFDNPLKSSGPYDFLINTVNLGNITISNVDRTNCSPQKVSPPWVSITFAPPDPITEILTGKAGGTNGNCSSIILTLSDSNGQSKNITVNEAGLVAQTQ